MQGIAYNLIWEFWEHGTTYDTKTFTREQAYVIERYVFA
jgi:hypothetical protein